MPSLKNYLPFVAAMAFVVVASNILVLYPFDHFGMKDVLTWGAFTYPIAFLVNDLTNRRYGKAVARRVVIIGFVLAVVLSFWLATPRIAIASGAAFLIGQLLDIQVFDRLRQQAWWKAPFMGTVFGSMLDTLIFFTLAFAPMFAMIDLGFGMEDGSLGFPASVLGYAAPLWVTLAFGDFCVKMLMGVLALVPYGALLNVLKPVGSAR
ncbi:MAG: queuosine precursor transporter [Rhizobiaceae bacterium]